MVTVLTIRLWPQWKLRMMVTMLSGWVLSGERRWLYLHPHAPSMGGPELIVSPKLWRGCWKIMMMSIIRCWCLMMTLIMIIIIISYWFSFLHKMISFHTSFTICCFLRDLGTSYDYNNVTVGLDIAGALRSWNSPFPGYSAPGRLLWAGEICLQ